MENKLDILEKIIELLLKERYEGDLTDEEEDKLHSYFMWGVNNE